MILSKPASMEHIQLWISIEFLWKFNGNGYFISSVNIVFKAHFIHFSPSEKIDL